LPLRHRKSALFLPHPKRAGSIIDDAPAGVINGAGLGRRFNANSCAACHSQPALGGSSPAVNPEVALATLDRARSSVPSFITVNGPIREARFIATQDGTPDGTVRDL
jgi:mono/diheme cytochrome c family protein